MDWGLIATALILLAGFMIVAWALTQDTELKNKAISLCDNKTMVMIKYDLNKVICVSEDGDLKYFKMER